ncbi:MAG TPA: CoA-transferase [Alphaproteobacteria bacterium]|jgi:glutaconate CoA-transferase subunit A|nr:CoA-transferase [Alphaproteobacteria bacterium]
MTEILVDSVEALLARLNDGDKIALVKSDNGVPMEAVRGIIRRGVKDLHLVCVPTGGIAADLLIGAGCIGTVETSAVSLDEYGQAPAFGRAVRSGAVRIMDATCPAVYAALQAGEKRIPFIPLRGLIGSDVQRSRKDWKVIDNPFGEDDPIVLLPAIVPDVALIHARKADRFGNLYIGDNRELMTMAHAARQTLATAESIVDDNLLEDPLLRPAVIPSIYVGAVAKAQNGARPLNLPGGYATDADHLALYARMAKSEEGFARYLDEFVFGRKAAAE